MPDFNVEQYIQQLESSASCETCPRVPHPQLGEDTRYIFISYSHRDYKMVYEDLAELYAQGIPFWYDDRLCAGEQWNETVRARITDPRCAGVIFYLSKNLYMSKAVETEIRIVRGEDANASSDAKRPYFAVNLEEQPPSQIRMRAMNELFSGAANCDDAQMAWMQFWINAFPGNVTYLSFQAPNHISRMIGDIGQVFSVEPVNTASEVNAAENSQSQEFLNEFYKEREFPDGSRYVGNTQNHIRNGHGKATFPDGAVYVGYWENDQFSGQGKITYPDGAFYEGQWDNGVPSGQGTLRYANGVQYTGQWKDGKPNGDGMFRYTDGGEYIGQWKDGQRNGVGKCTYPDKTVYEGNWENDRRNGKGKLTYSDGSVYIGDWVNDLQSGQCEFYRADGLRYIGGWQGNGSLGFGTEIYPNGGECSGLWNGDILVEGEGVIYYPDGSAYKGEIKKNKRHGQGVYVDAKGKVKKGRFHKDHFLGLL